MITKSYNSDYVRFIRRRIVWIVLSSVLLLHSAGNPISYIFFKSGLFDLLSPADFC